ncbi:hypothetical protein HYH03_000667 [Edaphochlamys debaryana]|uniref:Uncharacterized protein n=1 Tax=Edaphochlamys debaryana TaxID=47281 RepID=A0A836C6R6_9CHLO|nr:hypothetical protein HYH03_000667 [Edaphochlamys debaryana]|eukprot:KAG2502180.1 hypothetical protein HYH03_000667 [Edaphochlamys debaryana]
MTGPTSVSGLRQSQSLPALFPPVLQCAPLVTGGGGRRKARALEGPTSELRPEPSASSVGDTGRALSRSPISSAYFSPGVFELELGGSCQLPSERGRLGEQASLDPAPLTASLASLAAPVPAPPASPALQHGAQLAAASGLGALDRSRSDLQTSMTHHFGPKGVPPAVAQTPTAERILDLCRPCGEVEQELARRLRAFRNSRIAKSAAPMSADSVVGPTPQPPGLAASGLASAGPPSSRAPAPTPGEVEALAAELTAAGFVVRILDGTRMSKDARSCLRTLKHSFLVCLGWNRPAAAAPGPAAPAGAGSGAAQEQGSGQPVQPCEPLVVELRFREQFLIANPTRDYEHMLMALPVVFVGPLRRMDAVVELVAAEVAAVFKAAARPLPPWRTKGAMLSKWAPEQLADLGRRMAHPEALRIEDEPSWGSAAATAAAAAALEPLARLPAAQVDSFVSDDEGEAEVSLSGFEGRLDLDDGGGQGAGTQWLDLGSESDLPSVPPAAAAAAAAVAAAAASAVAAPPPPVSVTALLLRSAEAPHAPAPSIYGVGPAFGPDGIGEVVHGGIRAAAAAGILARAQPGTGISDAAGPAPPLQQPQQQQPLYPQHQHQQQQHQHQQHPYQGPAYEHSNAEPLAAAARGPAQAAEPAHRPGASSFAFGSGLTFPLLGSAGREPPAAPLMLGPLAPPQQPALQPAAMTPLQPALPPSAQDPTQQRGPGQAPQPQPAQGQGPLQPQAPEQPPPAGRFSAFSPFASVSMPDLDTREWTGPAPAAPQPLPAAPAAHPGTPPGTLPEFTLKPHPELLAGATLNPGGAAAAAAVAAAAAPPPPTTLPMNTPPRSAAMELAEAIGEELAAGGGGNQPLGLGALGDLDLGRAIADVLAARRLEADAATANGLGNGEAGPVGPMVGGSGSGAYLLQRHAPLDVLQITRRSSSDLSRAASKFKQAKGLLAAALRRATGGSRDGTGRDMDGAAGSTRSAGAAAGPVSGLSLGLGQGSARVSSNDRDGRDRSPAVGAAVGAPAAAASGDGAGKAGGNDPLQVTLPGGVMTKPRDSDPPWARIATVRWGQPPATGAQG